MEDIIKQIVQIDSVALKTRKNNEEVLKAKQKQYEEAMKNYEKEVLEEANTRAKVLYDQIVSSGTREYSLQEEKSKEVALNLKKSYLQVADSLLNQVFDELFKVEG